jgi:hypothetical protein
MRVTETSRRQQITVASARGAAFFRAGKPCMPALDDETMKMVNGRVAGHTPDGEASAVDIMDAWVNAWTDLNTASNRLVPRLF